MTTPATRHEPSCSFEDFLSSYHLLLRRELRRIASSLIGQDLEDLEQEVLTRVYQACYRIPTTQAAYGYALRTARNMLVDWQRRTARRDARWLGRIHLHQHVHSPDPADIVERGQQTTRVHRALQRLPLPQQRVARLALLDGLARTEVAEQTGFTQAGVKAHLQRARVRLRIQLSDLHE